MRTIRIEEKVFIDATSTTITVSTEIMIGDDGEAADAGREARGAVNAFLEGYAEDPR